LYGDEVWDPSISKPDYTPTPLRALFTQIMSFFAGTYAEVFSITEGPPLHDPLAVAAAFNPDIFDDKGGERFHVDIVTEGVHSSNQSQVGELGRTKLTALPEGRGGCRIPRGVDLDAFWGMIESAMKRADAVSPMPKLSPQELENAGVYDGVGKLLR
jgi:uridine nucleosidase